MTAILCFARAYAKAIGGAVGSGVGTLVLHYGLKVSPDILALTSPLVVALIVALAPKNRKCE